MRLYEGTVVQFNKDCVSNEISTKLAERFQLLIGHPVGPSEMRSWQSSLNYVNNALQYSDLNENMVVVEYQLPYSSSRIDVLLFGKDQEAQDSIVLIELKQWSNDKVKESKAEGSVRVDYGAYVAERPHPSVQVEGYHWNLMDFMTVFGENPPMTLHSCSYCHNYENKEPDALRAPKFERWLKEFPLFTREDVKNLGEYLQRRLRNGHGLEVFNRFIRSPIKPSKKLLTHTKEMINKQQIFNLIDEQIPVYYNILSEVKGLAKSNEKSIVIVKGGPGTGKSVIALEVMGELMRKGTVVFHATGSSAFTNTLRKILGVRSSHLFKFFNSFTEHAENSVEVLICDEAHRIRETSTNIYTPSSKRTDTPQIDELIRAAKLSVFFLDEHQIVRPQEVGSVQLIKDAAKKLGVTEDRITEFELKTQFRCNGSDSYLQWIENILHMTESDKQYLTPADGMDFKIVNDPLELKRIIDEKNNEKQNSARIVAGFCWPWSAPRSDGTLVADVKVGNLEMPWEDKKNFWKWATDESGMEQVGTVYTAQGFEFDYIGVIFGKDLVYDLTKGEWEAKPQNSYDSMAKRGNNNLVEHLKNVYRVLLSRAHKGCYVYFTDEDTRKFFESKIKNSEESP